MRPAGTFLLGMFWKRATGHGAFAGLLSGTGRGREHHGLTLPLGAAAGVKGGWIAVLHTYPSEMAAELLLAICAFSVASWSRSPCRSSPRARDEGELVGLVHSLTKKPSDGQMACISGGDAGRDLLVLTRC